jgi:ElaB/YqjD/DUF883 family membrane-anchored ribosome-binding protein
MSKLEEIRARVHNRMERWEDRLEALESQLEVKGEAAMKRLEDAAESLVDAAEDLEDKLEPAADELKQSLQELRVQMALGKAESRDAFDEQSNRVQKQLHAAEHIVDQFGGDLEARAGREMERFVQLGDRLKSELEAAELQFALGQAEARDAIDKRRSELHAKISEARAELKEVGGEAGERWQAFEDRMGNALGELRAALRELGGR